VEGVAQVQGFRVGGAAQAQTMKAVSRPPSVTYLTA
jgi:hypothetical protein